MSMTRGPRFAEPHMFRRSPNQPLVSDTFGAVLAGAMLAIVVSYLIRLL